MWSPIIFIALSQLFNFVSALEIKCDNRLFNEIEVQNAAINACKLRSWHDACRSPFTKINNKLNEKARAMADFLKKSCPTITGAVPTVYDGDLFDATEGPYISWHLTSLKRAAQVMTLKKDMVMYRVVVRYQKNICEPVGAIIIREGQIQDRCHNIKTVFEDTESDGKWKGEEKFQIPSHQNNPASNLEMFEGPERID